MLSNGKSLLARARAAGRYVPAFNIYNLETIQAALDASKSAGQPVILALGAAYIAQAPFRAIYAIADALSAGHPQEVVLHLDHCREMDTIREALDVGFGSVMFDGSQLPLAENIRLTHRVSALAAPYGASVEGELGALNSEDGEGDALRSPYTDAAQGKRFAMESGADSLAVSIGNAHGVYRSTPHLHFARLAEIEEATDLPLVLHGSSGIDMPTLRRAAKLGIAKVNVNTDIALAGAQAAVAALQAMENMRYDRMLPPVRRRMREVMESYFMQ
ncbi:MAG TPA: class II fructose-bisphosphate aldolase [Candidatus Limiplasma sp.]|nr:class II fructose-bisphosphate aldolase [Candidatus Limiplasma sp.]HRX08350.1 class II fructose-bisphosphate aldolase [Candidatus Limiplasma sp.]